MNSPKRLALAAGLLLASAAAAQPAAVTIDIRPIGDRRWQADYHWAEPVEALRFLYNGEQVRPGRWALSTPGTRLEPMGRTARIVRDDGRLFKSVSLQFEEDRRTLNGGYEFFQVLSDGSRLLFTGYLVARPMRRADDRASGLPGDIALRIHPRRGEWVAAAGTASDQPLRLQHSRGGSYVYLGRARPHSDEGTLRIVDPGAAPWVLDTVRTVLPATMAWYRDTLDAALPMRPSLLLSVDPDAPPGVGGGVLDGQVHIALNGPDWAERSPERHARLVRLLAHESAHLWNSRLARNRDHRQHRWLHEGSADALADAAIAALDLLPAARIRQFREDALNDCLQEIGSDSLQAMAERRRYGAHYDCGASLERLVAAHAAPGALWRHLLRTAQAQQGRYGLDDYLAAVGAVSGRKPLAVFGRRLATQGFDQPVQPWQAELRAAGIAHRLNTGPPDAAAQVRLVQIALAHLVEGDCGRPIPLKNHTRYYTVTGQRGCLALRPGETVRIEQVSGHGVATAGAAAYDAVVAACTGGQPVLLGDADTQWPAPCNQPLPARPPRFELLAPS